MSLGIFSAVWMSEIVDFISEIFLLANKFNVSSPNCHPFDTIEVHQMLTACRSWTDAAFRAVPPSRNFMGT